MDVQQELMKLAEEKYQAFQAMLIPNIPPETILGVRSPKMREVAKRLYNEGDWESYLNDLPHKYHEEYCVHGFVIEQIKDFDCTISELEKLLPYMDNWAVCDCINPKILGKYPEKLMEHIKKWIKSDSVYTVRYAMGALMRWYLDELFSPEYPAMVAEVVSEEYYIRMMQAWYFATAAAKQYDAVLPYFEEHRLEKWTHNKAIQKSVESFRVSDELKAQLKALRRK